MAILLLVDKAPGVSSGGNDAGQSFKNRADSARAYCTLPSEITTLAQLSFGP